MAKTLQVDNNRNPLAREYFINKKTLTFAGGTTNDIGDFDGTGNPSTVFTVTGTMMIKVFGVCRTALAGGSATLALGVATAGTGLITTTTATDLIANEVWLDATPTTLVEASSGVTEFIVGNGQDIICTVATANITSGVIDVFCLWKPISDDADVS